MIEKDNNKSWYFLYFFVIFFLSLSSLSIHAGIKIRYNQLFILLFFAYIFIDDLLKKRLDFPLLFILFGGGTLLSLISLNSIYPKVGEFKFIIKYLLIFPSTFYVGSRIFEKIGLVKFLSLSERVVLVYAVIGFIFFFFPLPIFTKLAATAGPEGVLSTYRGTFSETGWFAVAIGAFLLSSFSIRYDMHYWPKKRLGLILLYIFLLFSIGMSKNKTVWIAYVFLGFSFVLFKGFSYLAYSSYYQPTYKREKIPMIKIFSPIKTGYIIVAIILFVVLFFSVNEMLEKPIISWHMIQVKMQQERGKAFVIIMSLLQKSDWFGGYGFGFIEAFFTHYGDKVIGLGKGVGMIFNSYLDIWVSVSILGLIFQFTLLFISFSVKQYFTITIPIYFFIFANFNPATGSEYYYLFLGFSYGFIQYRKVLKDDKYMMLSR